MQAADKHLGIIHGKWWSKAVEVDEITKEESIERGCRVKSRGTLAIKVNRG